MTIIDLTSGRDVEIEDEPISLAERLEEDAALGSRQQYTGYRQRVLIRFDDRTYTLEEFRDWVRRLKDVETSTDPEKAGVVARMRKQLREQEEIASGVVGALSKRDRDLWEELRRVKAERDALIAEKARQS
jgi:hypothetical protein